MSPKPATLATTRADFPLGPPEPAAATALLRGAAVGLESIGARS
jgi:hypothetical protein